MDEDKLLRVANEIGDLYEQGFSQEQVMDKIMNLDKEDGFEDREEWDQEQRRNIASIARKTVFDLMNLLKEKK